MATVSAAPQSKQSPTRRWAVICAALLALALLFGLDAYEDEDRVFNPANDIRDLHYVINRLRLNEVIDFARSFEDWEIRWTALRGGFFRGLVYQEDIHALLTHPAKRLLDVR